MPAVLQLVIYRVVKRVVFACIFPSSPNFSLLFFPDVLSEESHGEGGGGAETETAEVRAEPPGQSDQRAGPPQENGGGVILNEYPLTIIVN